MTGGAEGFFITGTDTGVGKTVVSAVIIRALSMSGIKAGVMKPVETGCIQRDGGLIPADALFLREAAEIDDPIDLISPVRYVNPVAPMVAEKLENRKVDLDRILNAYKTLSRKYGFMVIEGIGGLMVPVTRRQFMDKSVPYFVSDLIKALNLQVIIAARPSLGTVNHTLLTVHHALGEGLKIAGIVLNNHDRPGDTVSERTNPAVLSELCGAPVIGPLPHMEHISLGNIDLIAAEFRDSISALTTRR
jgi:dethiobiotin synthetase